MKAAYLLVLGMLCCAILAQTQKPPKDTAIWVVDDTVKVHPITGSLLREGVKVHSGDSGSNRSYRQKNSVWNAETNTVRLFAGRNEFVSFQIILEKNQEDLHKFFVTISDLIGPGERISSDHSVQMFKQLYVQREGNWYPEAMVPFELAGVTPMNLPDPDGLVGNGQRVQSIWVDVFVPHELPPGLYSGRIAVLHRTVNKQAVLNLELEVGDFTLSDELHLDVDLMNYGYLNIERGWSDMLIDGPRHRKIELEFFRMAHQHRMSFALVPYNHDGSIPKGLKPELAGVGETIRVRDWSSWDERFGPVLSGEAFKDLPRAGQPVGHFFLPYNLMWPSDMRNWMKPAYRTEYKRIAEQFRSHLAAKGWTKPEYHIYYNHKEHYLFYPWNLDEPTRDKDYEALRYIGEILDESFPDESPVNVLYRLDIGHFFCKNVSSCRHPREESQRAIEELGAVVDLWNIGSAHFFPNADKGGELKRLGKTLYFYGATSSRISDPLLEAALWGWRGYRYDVDGICLWHSTDWTDWDMDRPVPDPLDFGDWRYEGVSILFYPGERFGLDGPLPSIRLKGMRRGLQDFEYLRLVEEGSLKTRSELDALVDSVLDSQGLDYYSVRRSLFDLLSKD